MLLERSGATDGFYLVADCSFCSSWSTTAGWVMMIVLPKALEMGEFANATCLDLDFEML